MDGLLIMAYLPKLNPTVGGGLGGLPERRGVATVKGLQTEEVSISLLGSVTNGDYIYKSKDGNYYQTKNYTYFPKNGDYTSATLFKPYEAINGGTTGYFSMYRYSPASRRFFLGSSYGGGGAYGCASVYDSNGIALFNLCTSNSSYYQGTRVAVSPDGSKEMFFCGSSYVSNYGTIVTRHDGKAYTAQTNSTNYNYPYNFAINNNGDIFAVYDNGSGTLYVSKVLLNSTENKYSYSSALQVNGTVLVALSNNNFILLSSTSLYYFDSSFSLITSNVVNFPFSTSTYHNPLGVMNRLNGNVLLTKSNGSLYELVLSGTTFTFNTLYNTTSFYEMGAVSESSDGYIFVSSTGSSDNAYTLDSSFALVTNTGFSSHVRCLSPIDNGWVCGFPTTYTNPSKHIKTNKELLYFVGVANESKTYSQNNTPINVKVLTSGVKTTAIDYRNVGGAALLTSAITP